MARPCRKRGRSPRVCFELAGDRHGFGDVRPAAPDETWRRALSRPRGCCLDVIGTRPVLPGRQPARWGRRPGSRGAGAAGAGDHRDVNSPLGRGARGEGCDAEGSRARQE